MFKKMKALSFIYSVVLIVAITQVGWAKAKKVVAVVNGVEITRDEFLQRLTETIGKPLLDQMINEIILQQKAEKEKVEVTSKEIDAKIEEMKKQFPNEQVFKQQLSRGNMTIEMLRHQLKNRLLLEKILSKDVTVTDGEIKEYFEANKKAFSTPEVMNASHILVKTKAEANEIVKELKEGADFAKLAKKHSIDPATKDKGGELGFFSREQLVPAIAEEAFSLKTGEISDVVQTSYGYHIIKAGEKKAAQEATLDSVKEKITEILIQVRVWDRAPTWIQGLRQEAQVEIKAPELKD
jgi:foldase protein PrsA